MATQDRREQDRARRKRDILLSARSVFADNGFHRATVDEIAQGAEVAKGTIYLYFENKEAILAELVLQALAELHDRLEAASETRSLLHPDGRLRAMAEAYLAFSQHAPDYFRLLTVFDGGHLGADLAPARREMILAASNQTLDIVTQAIADGMALGIYAAGDARQIAAILWAGLSGCLALLAHPIRRAMLGLDPVRLYHDTTEVLLSGMAHCDEAPSKSEREKSP